MASNWMHLTLFDYARLGAGLGLEVAVCVLAIWRGVWRRLPSFVIYISFLVFAEAARWVSYLSFGLGSKVTFAAYWITQGALLLLRGAVVVELCWRLLRPYPGIWKLSKGLLASAGVALAAVAGYAAVRSGSSVAATMSAAERGMEIAIVGVLLLGLAFCRYYRVPVSPFLALLAFGLGLYSAIQVVNNTFLIEWLRKYFPFWAEIRLNSFLVALVVWLWALRAPLGEAQRAPALLGPSDYVEWAPAMSGRLRELNARLQEMLW